MSESETTPEIGPRFTKATIIRISAVAFFVTLGSVAVIQSMKYVSSGSNEDPSQLVSDAEIPISGGETLNEEANPSQPPSAFEEPAKSAASKNTFGTPKNVALSTGKPTAPGLVKTTLPPVSSFKPASPPLRTSASTFNAPQKGVSANTKKPLSNSGSGFNGIPLVKATPPVSPPERYASKGAPLPFSNPSRSFKLSNTPNQNLAATKSAPKQTDTQKPDPFKIRTPPKQGSDILEAKATPPVSTSNSASRLLNQATAAAPSTRSPPPLAGGFAKPAPANKPVGQPTAKSFATPANQPSQQKLTNSQTPQTTTNDPALPNIGSFNNRPRPTKNPAAITNSSQAQPAPTKLSTNLNNKFPGSEAPKVPTAFASQPSLGKTPTPNTQPFGSPQRKSETGQLGTGQLGPPLGLTSQTNPIRAQTPKAFAPKTTYSNLPAMTKRSSLTGMPSASAATSVPRLTRDTPGDRQLEGIQAPSLTIEKLSPVEIQLNQQASFEIIVRNIGRVTERKSK